MRYRAEAVRGNHDDYALQVYSQNLSFGVEKKSKWARQMTESQAGFLAEMPFTISIPELKIVIVHAGVIPGLPIQQQNLEDLFKMRFLKKDKGRLEAFEVEEDSCSQWAELWKGESKSLILFLSCCRA